MEITNQPPKGTADWFPDEFAVRKYIFDTWRKVCLQFGYEEYMTPIVELADVYRAKSGEDVGGKELTVFEDRGGRELAIRPEMTPSVTRMVTRNYESQPKPIRYFSIANFFRNEKPQKGRNREFWQLNYDVFGSDSLNADVEIVQMAIEIMKALDANKDQFVVYLNDRELIEAMVTDYLGIPSENVQKTTRLLDKFAKLSREDFIGELRDLGASIEDDGEELIKLLSKDNQAAEKFGERMKDNPGWQRLIKISDMLSELGYYDYVDWNPAMVRGFDYYDGIVFEVFDKSHENTRSLFGGGRYNGLAGIFGKDSFPAVGCAPGDETTRLFLEEWGLIPENLQQKPEIYVPLLAASLSAQAAKLAQGLRAEGKRVLLGTEEQKLSKALDFADKQGILQVAILGEDEAANGTYQLKDMQSGEQQEQKL